MRKSHSASGLTSSSSGYTYEGGMSSVQKRRNTANRIVRFRKDTHHPDGSLMALMRFKERGKEQQSILDRMKSNIKARKASGKNLSQKNSWLEEHNYLASQKRDLERDLMLLVRKYPSSEMDDMCMNMSVPISRTAFESQQDIQSSLEALAIEELSLSSEIRDITTSIMESEGASVRPVTVASIEKSLPNRLSAAVAASNANHVDDSLVDLFKDRLQSNLVTLRERLNQQDRYFEERCSTTSDSFSNFSRPPTGCSDRTELTNINEREKNVPPPAPTTTTTTTTTTPTGSNSNINPDQKELKDMELVRCPTATTSMTVSCLSMCSDMQRIAKVINAERVFGRKTREELTDKIQLEFPEWDLKTAQQQLWGYELRMFVKSRKRSLIDDFESNTNNVLSALTSAVRQRSELIDSEARAALLAEERAKEQNTRHEHLEKLRDEKKERDAVDLERQLAESAALAAAQEEINKKREAEFNNRLRKLADFRQQKAAEEEQASREREAAAIEDLRKHELLMKEGKTRVEYREQELTKRLNEVRAAKAQAEHEKQMRAAVLNAIAASVAPLVERDANRLVKATCSSSSVTDPKLVNEEFANQTRQNGYTDDQIVQDKRFQLTEALGQAGLLNTEYARQVIFNAAPKGPSVTSLQTQRSNPLHVSYKPAGDSRDIK